MFPLKNTEAYIHANGFRSTLGKELADRDAAINELGSEIQALTNKLTDEAETRSALGAKNLLSQNPLTTFTESGVTITRNADGSITVSTEAGGATARVSNVLHDFVVNGSVKDTSLNGKRIILSGCPAGGSSSTYYIQFFRYDGSNTAYDYGEGTEPLDVNVGTTGYVNITMRVESGTVITTPITFKPMVRLATDSDPTYQPYAKTNVELTQESASADYTDQSLFTNIDDTAIARPNLRVYKRGSAIYGIFTFDIIRTVTNDEVLFKAPIAPKVDTNFVGTGVGTSDLAQGFVWKSNGNVCSYGSNTAADYISSSVSTIIS